MSTTEPVCISQVKIENYPCFRGENVFSFLDKNEEWCQWTVFLGENNTGKRIAFCDPNNKGLIKLNSSIEVTLKLFTEGGMECVYEEPTTERNYAEGIRDKIAAMPICAYGVAREIESKGITTSESDQFNSLNLFYNSKRVNFEDWLFQLDYAAKNQNATPDDQGQAKHRRDLLKELIASVVLTLH